MDTNEYIPQRNENFYLENHAKYVSAPYTMVPNYYADHWIPLLSGNEFKILYLVIRKTTGWHKPQDKISLSQIVKLTGITKKTVISCLDELLKLNLIFKIKSKASFGDDETNQYGLIVHEDEEGSVKITPPPSVKITPPGSVKITHTKETLNKEIKGGEEPTQKIKANPKKKEVTQTVDEILKFGDHVQLKKKSYADLCEEYGTSNIEYYINAINNWVPNNRTYKDYAAAIRQWLLKDQKDGKFKSSAKCVNNNAISVSEENRKYAEKVENRLINHSNCYVHFTAGATEFVHFNSNKDIQEKLSYECSKEEFREKLLRSLSRSIPAVKNILYPTPAPKHGNIGISQLVQQCKVN